jgi:hypothetical protein
MSANSLPVDLHRIPTVTEVIQPRQLDALILQKLQTGGMSELEKQAWSDKLVEALRPGLEQWLQLTVKHCVNELVNSPRSHQGHGL